MLKYFLVFYCLSLKAFSYNAIGLMSGTSMDGIDTAFLETDGEGKIEEGPHIFLPYSKDIHFLLKSTEFVMHRFKGNLKKVHACNFEKWIQEALRIKFSFSHSKIQFFLKEIKKKLHIKKISYQEVENYSTYLHGQAFLKLLKKLQHKKIDVIGYHGQTLFHNPSKGITIQMGNGKKFAQLKKISVVNDFRSLDVKNKGQRAPLISLYHSFAHKYNLIFCAIVICGGISNVTFIFKNSMMGFDTGPGNVLINLFVKIRTKETMDYNAKLERKEKFMMMC